MKKDFDKWNLSKKSIDHNETRPYFHEREIWFCKLGLNVGFEQDGKGEEFLRPVLVLKKFNRQVFIGLPMTTSLKESKFYYIFESQKASVVLSQVRLLDSKRLSYRISKISENEIVNIKEKLMMLLS